MVYIMSHVPGPGPTTPNRGTLLSARCDVVRGTVTQFHFGFHTNFLFNPITVVLFWLMGNGRTGLETGRRSAHHATQIPVSISRSRKPRPVREIYETSSKRKEMKTKQGQHLVRQIICNFAKFIRIRQWNCDNWSALQTRGRSPHTVRGRLSLLTLPPKRLTR